MTATNSNDTGNGHDKHGNRHVLTTTQSGRPIKFTPERMEQIRNLVERGHQRHEIADIIGCTVGSLQVTCSRYGISLRQPKREVAAPFKPALEAPKLADVPPPPDPIVKPVVGATFTMRVTYPNHTYDLLIPIDDETLCELACVAEVNGMPLTEVIARAIVVGVRRFGL